MDGTGTAPNKKEGIRLSAASNTLIGGTTDSARNIISGNLERGITIEGNSSVDNVINRNYIGLDVFGTDAVANGMEGIKIDDASRTIIGELNPDPTKHAGQTISGNNLHGVLITGANATGNKLIGNFIGTDKDGGNVGGKPFGNILGGVKIDGSSSNIIGDATKENGGNVISGNGDDTLMIPAPGIEIVNGNTNTIQNNKIGTKANGNDPLNNYGEGILISSGLVNLIGGNGKHQPNTISGNKREGIRNNGVGTIILKNDIGKNKLGLALPNEQGGIAVAGSNAQIEGNQVWFNLGDGITVTSGTGNRITANSIKGNSALGIDLADDGVTSNDTLDPDSGPNILQNFPVLTSAVVAAGATTITGSLNSVGSGTYTIQFFGNNVSSVGDAEGEYYLGSTVVVTNGSGNASFSTTLAASFGTYVTAAAIDSAGKTSEFSAAVAVTQGSPAATISGRVWSDADSDGIQDTGEASVAGVLVKLYNSSGTLIGSTMTDSNGQYSFTSVAAGTYRVGFQLPADGYSGFSPKDQGGNDAIDSDANTATSLTDYFTLLGTGIKDHLDAGFIPAL